MLRHIATWSEKGEKGKRKRNKMENEDRLMKLRY